MSSLSRFFTLLKFYFGDSISRLLSLVYCGKMNGSVDSSSSIGDLTTDTDSAAFKPDEGSSSGAISQLLDALESSPDTNEFTRQNLLPCPRLVPARHPPSSLCKQDFGAPSNLYYDCRTLGDATNFDQAKGAKLNTEVKPWKALKPKQPKSRRRRPAMATAKVLPVEDSSATVVVKLAPPTLPAPVAIAVIDPAPAPGSEEWNTNNASVLAQARNWSNQVQPSRRHSLPVPPLPIDLPVLERSHRHSAPPVLVTADKLNLQDRLSALFKEAKDTIAALDEERRGASEEGREENFVIGEDSEEEEVITTAPRTSRQERTTDILPPSTRDISTRSISDLFNTLDAVMTGPTWRRVLSRSDDITRRANDSIV
ncbi:hypothetical protein B0H14DRAFT_3851440 [Mycena olivaceomarginata]|nr:hypothetical protein B0H14DRAFT_3851440 [Mycena olivaceomarginata]